MLKCMSNDSKLQMRLNIKRHRQKLLQYLENTNDTFLKPKIKLVSNDIEKSNLNHYVQPKIAPSTEFITPKEKSNLDHNVQPKIASSTEFKTTKGKSNLNQNVQPKIASSTEFKTTKRKSNLNQNVQPKIAFSTEFQTTIEKSNLDHNVQPKIASSTEFKTTKGKSNLNQNVQPKIASSTEFKTTKGKSNLNQNVQPKIAFSTEFQTTIEKSNLNHNVQPKIASSTEFQTTIEKSNLNHNVQPKIASSTEFQTTIEKSNLNHNVQPKIASSTEFQATIEKSNLNHNVQPKIASSTEFQTTIEKSNLNHNVQPKIASSTELQTPKRLPTFKVINYKNKSAVRVKTYELEINTKPKNLEVLTVNDIKENKTRSSITVNHLPPNIKVNIQKEPLSKVILKPKPLSKYVELKPKPLSKYVELKPKPLPNIEIKDPEPPPVKKLKEQLLEELLDSSSSEEIDDNISVGNDDDWNEIYQTHNESDVDENDSSYSQLAGDKSKEEYMSDTSDSDDSILDINCPTTNKRSRTRKKMKSQFKIDHPKHRFRKPLDRSLHNAKERACRERIAKKFAILRKCCSYLNTNRRVPSKHSILLAAKKECDLLKHFEKKMLAEKKVWSKANEILKNRIAEFYTKL